MKIKHLLALALIAIGGSAWADVFQVDANLAIDKAAGELDGIICVITDANNEKVFSTNMPGKAAQDVQGLELTNWGSKDTHKYIKFTKPSGYTQPAEGNVYFIHFINANGEKHPAWGITDSPLNQTGGTALFVGLDANHQSKYGQDRDNGALWKVVKEAEGYTLQNVATNQYATPANNDVQNDKQYVNLFSKLVLIDGSDITSCFIKNPGFNNGTWNEGWSGIGTDKKVAFLNQNNSDSFTKGNVFAEMWCDKNNKLSAADLNQTILGLPSGHYTLSAKIQNDIPVELYVSINGTVSSITIPKTSVKVQSLTFYNPTEGNVQIGLKHNGTSSNGQTWVAVDDFTLEYHGESLPNNYDLTSRISNPSFESDFTGWTNTGSMATQTNTSLAKDGAKYAEFWQPNGTKGVEQSIAGLPAGQYKLTVRARTRGTQVAYIYINDVKTNLDIDDSEKDYVVTAMADDNATLRIGLSATGTGASGSWIACDNFRLTYVSSEYPELTAVEGAMNADAASAQTTAIDTYIANKTVANYEAAVAAINVANASVNAYKQARYFLDQAQSAKGTNFTTSNATDYATAVAALEAKYTNGEFTDAEAQDRIALIGERRGNALVPNYMLGGWDSDIYINTWSTEGDNDGSNFKTPFYEYWVADANALANKTITGTLTGLPNGLYSISADVRVRAKNGTAAADATGINLVAGDGTYTGAEGNGTVDATEGDQIGTSQMSKSSVIAYALVKDGNLTANFVVEGTNISWLAFQNVTYTKVRDLTPEEAAIIPTAIALDKTEATLTAAANTVTLVPTFTPDDATNTVTWETSDANVATVNNGVVTGVAPGTATITVKSTLDENVKATCEVTVEYPETAYEKSAEAVDSENKAILHVTTLSDENLIKNGSFEYPNGYYGFTYGNAAAVNPISSTGFDIVEDNGNHYLKAKKSDSGATASSLCTAWPIENGKSYVFSFDIKANASCTTNLQYIGTSLSNTTSEDANHKFANVPAYGTEWKTVKYQFTNSENLKYLVFNSRWLANAQSFDNFYLVEVADESIIGNVEYAVSQIPTSNVGTGAFQYSQDAVDATNALVKGEATVQNVEDAIEAMTILNAPADGDKFHVAITFDGYRYSGHALEANATATSGVAVPLADNTDKAWIANDWTFTPVAETKNGFTMSITTAEGTYYVCTGKQDNGSNDQQIRMTTDPAKALTIVVSPAKSQEGVYYLNNTRSSNASIGCQDDNATKNGGWYTTGSHNTHTITPATKATANLTIVENVNYGTFIAPFNADAPSGVTLYTCAAVENNTLTLVEASTIVANTPYIVYSSSAESENLTGWGLATTDKYTEGLLTGTYTEQAIPTGSYILSKKNDKVGFYLTNEGRQNQPNRVYMTVSTSAREAFFFDGDETAINAIDALTSGKAEIYDLNGRKLNRLQKGINIVNGTKIIVK